LSFLRCIPNMWVMTPSDENECRKMLSTAFLHDGPAAVRYPRGAGAGVAVERSLDPLPAGRGEIRRHSRAHPGSRVAILAFGPLLYPALRAAEALDATVFNMRFVKPLDVELLAQVARSHDALVSVEENVVMGGAGSACSEALSELGIEHAFLHLGLPDRFIDHGDPGSLMSGEGLDAAGSGSGRCCGKPAASSRSLDALAASAPPRHVVPHVAAQVRRRGDIVDRRQAARRPLRRQPAVHAGQQHEFRHRFGRDRRLRAVGHPELLEIRVHLRIAPQQRDRLHDLRMAGFQNRAMPAHMVAPAMQGAQCRLAHVGGRAVAAEIRNRTIVGVIPRLHGVVGAG
jgi:hypothetical protein